MFFVITSNVLSESFKHSHFGVNFWPTQKVKNVQFLIKIQLTLKDAHYLKVVSALAVVV
jgi:hypothetical protein